MRRFTVVLLLDRVFSNYFKGFQMKALSTKFVEFLKKEDGPTAVEYAVMLALIIVVCIAAITALGQTASNTFSFVNTKMAAGNTAGAVSS
jgi:pilus assembly protein Flp/PilA